MLILEIVAVVLAISVLASLAIGYLLSSLSRINGEGHDSIRSDSGHSEPGSNDGRTMMCLPAPTSSEHYGSASGAGPNLRHVLNGEAPSIFTVGHKSR